LKKKLAKIIEALERELLQSGNFIKTDTGERLALDEVERNIVSEEWLKMQEYNRRNPELKKNTFFMSGGGAGVLPRSDSHQDEVYIRSLKQKKGQNLTLYEELQLLKLENQKFDEERKKETYYERVQKMKNEHEKFHKFSFLNVAFNPESLR
jgi:lipopolysaccharide export LptBFGC system permease protein LptF